MTAAVRSGIWLPPFGELADPRVVTRVAVEAEAAGWHGVFLWDQLRWREPVSDVGDAWITLAAVAAVTDRVRLGPMITPLARRRPAKVAKESAALDRLSGGRLTLGVGLGSDRFARELSKTGEQVDDRVRGQMLDEALDVLTAAWTGETVHHDGEHYMVDGMRFLPQPVQQPGVPVWVAALPGSRTPLRRAARFDGVVPTNLESADQLAEMVGFIKESRDGRPFDVAVALAAEVDPMPYVEAGATWWLPELEPQSASLDTARGLLRDGPATG